MLRPSTFPILLFVLTVGVVVGCGRASPGGESGTSEAPAADTRATAIPHFLAWARENGAELDPRVKLQSIPGFGLGLRATAPIAAGERYVTFDEKLLIGRDRVLADPRIGSALGSLDARLRKDTRLLLVLFLLHHRHVQGADSHWWPYLQVLPRGYDDSPMFYGEESLALLEGSYLHTLVRRERARRQRTFDGIRRLVLERFPGLFPADRIGYDEYLWAVWTTNSRLFFIEGLSPREHLLPLADMVNCEEPPERQDLQFAERGPGPGQVQLRADRAFAAGEQIFESYGYKSNLELLLYEGFLLPSSPNDCVWVEVSTSEADSQVGRQRRRPPWLCIGASELRRGRIAGHALKVLRRISTGRAHGTQPAEADRDDRPVLALLQDAVRRGLEQNRFTPEDKRSHPAVRFRVLEKRQLRSLDEAIDRALRQSGPIRLAASPTRWPAPGAPTTPGRETGSPSGGGRVVIAPDAPLPSRPRGFDLGGFCHDAEPGCLLRKTDALNRWVRAKGAKLKVEARPAPGMRVGAFATSAISPGSVYIQMPDSALLEASDADRSDIASMLAGLDARSRLLLLVLHEARKGASSPFAPYLDALPEFFEDVPITWSRDKLETFAGTGVLREALKRRRALERQYDAFRTGIQVRQAGRFGWVTLDDFVWASMVLSSRCIWWDGTCHLVPVLDMVNCSEGPGPAPYPPHRTEFDDARQASITRARAAFERGEQVFENYAQPNFGYVAVHGFLLEDNSYEAVLLNLDGRRLLLGPRRLKAALRRVQAARPGMEPPEVLDGLIGDRLAALPGDARTDALLAKDGGQPEHVRLAARLRSSQREMLVRLLRE